MVKKKFMFHKVGADGIFDLGKYETQNASVAGRMSMPTPDDNSRQRRIIRLLLGKPDASVEDISRTLYGQGFPVSVSTIKAVQRIMRIVLDEQDRNSRRSKPASRA